MGLPQPVLRMQFLCMFCVRRPRCREPWYLDQGLRAAEGCCWAESKLSFCGKKTEQFTTSHLAVSFSVNISVRISQGRCTRVSLGCVPRSETWVTDKMTMYYSNQDTFESERCAISNYTWKTDINWNCYDEQTQVLILHQKHAPILFSFTSLSVLV